MCDVTLAYPEGGEVKDDLLLNQRVDGWRAHSPHEADRFFGAHPLVYESASQHGAGPPLPRVAVDNDATSMIGIAQESQERLDLLNRWSAEIRNRQMKVAEPEAAHHPFIQRPLGHGDDGADPPGHQEGKVFLQRTRASWARHPGQPSLNHEAKVVRHRSFYQRLQVFALRAHGDTARQCYC